MGRSRGSCATKKDGKWSWLGLGGYPEISGSFARQKAAQLRDNASTGKNPLVSKQARKIADWMAANNTFEALGREWFEARRSSWEAGPPVEPLVPWSFMYSPFSANASTQKYCPLNGRSFCAAWNRKGSLSKWAEFGPSAKRSMIWHA